MMHNSGKNSPVLHSILQVTLTFSKLQLVSDSFCLNINYFLSAIPTSFQDCVYQCCNTDTNKTGTYLAMQMWEWLFHATFGIQEIV